MGLFAGIEDPAVLAAVVERNRLVKKIAEQMHISFEDARDALWWFENVTTSAGQTVH
jgi:predicted nuclease of restriction endonuclease-like RecB superfamily